MNGMDIVLSIIITAALFRAIVKCVQRKQQKNVCCGYCSDCRGCKECNTR